ncbi:MAG: hypothetical protein ACRD4R_04210 [Candidatus Acidiferrales bacterium]
MALSQTRRRGWIEVLVFLASAIALATLAPGAAVAQRAAVRRPPAARYVRPRHMMRPMRPIRPAVPRSMPIRRTILRMPPGPAGFRYARRMPVQHPAIGRMHSIAPVGARTFVAPRTFAAPVIARRNFGALRMSRPGFARQWIGARGFYVNPTLFGGAYFTGSDTWESRNYQMLPLGFGLWPACDSASIPGRFWTIGPCAGIGDYVSVTPSNQSQYMNETAALPYFYEPEIFLEQPQAAQRAAKRTSAPQKKANMVVYLTDGRALAVSDWWVTEGRFYFTPLNGANQSVDLPTLDLQKTIEENEKQGLTFILNFTPPGERPVLPALTSNP